MKTKLPTMLSFGLYLSIIAITNLIWEISQLPFYSLWTNGSIGEIVFAVVHCTAGDVLIAVSALAIATTVLSGAHSRFKKKYQHHVLPFLAFAIVFARASSSFSLSMFVSTMPTKTSSSEPLPNQSTTRFTALAATCSRGSAAL